MNLLPKRFTCRVPLAARGIRDFRTCLVVALFCMKKKILLAWSSGKDSAWALHVLRQQDQYEIAGLMTTLNAAFDRVAMHSTRNALVEMQAEAAGLPLIAAPIPWPCSNADYEAAMKLVCDQALAQGISAIAFGDLFLTDVRAYRERQLKDTGLEPLFPIWGIPTALAQEMIGAGLRQNLSAWIPNRYLPALLVAILTSRCCMTFPPAPIRAAKTASSILLSTRDRCLTRDVQPKIPIEMGEKVERDGFWFCDVLPAVTVPE